MGEYVGVFVCDQGVEQSFANAEPPAHDKWELTNVQLKDHDKTYVKMALNRIKDEMGELARPPVPQLPQGTSTADIADRLGAVLLGATGPAPGGSRPSTSTGGSSRGSSRPSFLVTEQSPALFRNQECAIFRISTPDGESPPAGLELKPRILDMDGKGQSIEGENPELIVGIERTDGTELAFTNEPSGNVILQESLDVPVMVYVAYPAGGEFALKFDVAVTHE
jgi:hypothetical protein